MPPPIIGLVSTDIKAGADFYRDFELLMAKLWPCEAYRPVIYAEFGLSDQSTPELATEDNCDLVFKVTPAAELEPGDLQEPGAGLMASLIQEAREDFERLNPGEEFELSAADNMALRALFMQLAAYMPHPEPVASDKQDINVLGGMGPIAGANFVHSLSREVEETGLCEQTTLKIYSNPQTPGLFLPVCFPCCDTFLHTLDYIQRFRTFVNESRGLLVAPCNTFHTNVPALSWISQIQDKIFHIVKQVEKQMFGSDAFQTIAVMGTERTVDSELYEGIFAGSGKEIFSLKDKQNYRKMVQDGILLVKEGYAAEGGAKFRQVIEYIKDQFQEAPATPIISGCTEIVIGCRAAGIIIEPPLYDSADILAHSTAQAALLSPTNARNHFFIQHRDFHLFFSYVKQHLMRHNLALIKDDKEPSAACTTIQDAITQLYNDAHGPLTAADYKNILTIIFTHFKQATEESPVGELLGNILDRELSRHPHALHARALEEFNQILTAMDPPAPEADAVVDEIEQVAVVLSN